MAFLRLQVFEAIAAIVCNLPPMFIKMHPIYSKDIIGSPKNSAKISIAIQIIVYFTVTSGRFCSL